MKRIIIGLVIALASAQTANADVYVKVDANGNAIGGAIMCDAATCGAGSQYSQLTLGPGERYVLQGVGVHHGIGNNNPGTDVKHEAATNEWVVTNNNAPTPTVERFTVITPEPVAPSPTPVLPQPETTTVVSDTATVTVDTATVVSDTATTVMDLKTIDWATIDWETFWIWFERWFEQMMGIKP